MGTVYAQLSDQQIRDYLTDSFVNYGDPDPAGVPDQKVIALRSQPRDTTRVSMQMLEETEKSHDIANLLSFLASFDDLQPARTAARNLLERKPIRNADLLYVIALSDVVRRVGIEDDERFFLPLFTNFDSSLDLSTHFNALLTLSAIGGAQTQKTLVQFLESSEANRISSDKLRHELVERTNDAIAKINQRQKANIYPKHDVVLEKISRSQEPIVTPGADSSKSIISNAATELLHQPKKQTLQTDESKVKTHNTLIFVLLGILALAGVVCAFRKSGKDSGSVKNS